MSILQKVTLTVEVDTYREGDVYKARPKCPCGAWAIFGCGERPELDALLWLAEHVEEAHEGRMPMTERPPFGTIAGEGEEAFRRMRNVTRREKVDVG
jgi:hypothetical protein